MQVAVPGRAEIADCSWRDGSDGWAGRPVASLEHILLK